MKNNIKELKQKALSGDLAALDELRRLGLLSANKAKYKVAPVSYSQRRLWFIDKMEKSPAYNLPAAIMLEGNLNTSALEDAFNKVIRRHEILRTVFIETDGVPFQKIFNEPDFKLSISDISQEDNREQKIDALMSEELNRCFDLSKGPLTACRLIKTEINKYWMLFNMHHIISDGWSVGILISELTQFYNSTVKDTPASLENLKIQYSDYVRKQNKLLEDPGSGMHRAYWLEKFSGELPVSELPPDKTRPVYKTFSGKLYELLIDENLHRKIESFCRQKNVSLFMFMVAVVNVLINKYSGKSDIIIGTPVSGREQRDLEDQIGFYVNTIPLRNKVEINRSFSAFLEEVKKNCVEAYSHQVYPFDLLIEDLELERNTGRNPLFETVVSLQEANADKLEFEGLKTTIAKHDSSFSKFDLHFNIEEAPSVMKIGIIYNTDLYTGGKIRRTALHLLEILNNILLSPDSRIADIEFITSHEREQILNVFNNTSGNYPKDNTIAELFEEIAEKYPDKAAVVYRGVPVSYKQLNEKANFLAGKLRSCGVKIEDPVAIRMERSHNLVASILGVLKAGGAYLPLDINMPEERLKFILRDVKADLLLTDKKYDNTDFYSGQVICADAKFFEDSENCRNIAAGKTPSNLAYILYTSGSTGTPKGSMIEDRSVIRLVKNTNYINFTDEDRLLSISSISFDAVTLDLWGILLNGGTLYFEDSEDYLDPEKLGHFISDYKLNKILFPTGLFVRMSEADYQNNLNLFAGLKTIIVGGDKLPYINTNRLLELYPGIDLINGYGPTENTTFTTFYYVKSFHSSDIPIGKPVSNTAVYIFNESGNLCPAGVQGELYIGGDGLSRGYVNRPDLNREKFVVNPINKNEILYRSGDICEWYEDGNIRFIGRNDDQLKIRGFRIETGEIENTAAKYKGIKSTRVLVIQEDEQKELALYYTANEKINENEIRKYLGSILPEYMLPKYYLHMDVFPLNNNGKIDLKAFPQPGITLNNQNVKSGPLTITERKLAGIFESILNVEHISLSESFFSRGGHSLKAIKAVSAIQKELSVNVSLKEFFAHPDILSLSEIIKDRKREAVGKIPAAVKAECYELSHAQKRLWVLDKIEKSKSAYNVPLALSLNDSLDLKSLQSAFDDLILRHESLRTVFIEKDGEPFQKILAPAQNIIKVVDFAGSPSPDESALMFITDEAQRSFNLQEFSLIRLYVIKTAPEKQLLFINIHHIICDGWSVNVLACELLGTYSRYINKSAELASPAPAQDLIQYKDYAAWQNKMIHKGESNDDRRYWLEKLGGEITVPDIPADFQRPAVKTYAGKSYYYAFPADLKKELDKFVLDKRSTLFITLTAAIKVLLHKYTGAEDIIIGSPLAGRNHPDLEDQIGCYVNTLALRDNVKPDMTFMELLEGVKKTSVDAYAHQMYPFDKLLDEIKIPRDTSRSPLFDIVIVLNNFEFSYKDIFEKAEPYNIPLDISKYDLTFNFQEMKDGLHLLIEYNTDLFRQERIEQLASHLSELLKNVIESSLQKIMDLNIIGNKENSKLLFEFNDTKAQYPEGKTVIDLFEEAVEKYPLNTAVVYQDRSLTYEDLNNKAGKAAAWLLSKYSVSKGQPVGVLMPPSENTIITLLAVLKCGGAYVPVDPEYPDERIKHILSESGMSIILTTAENEARLQNIIVSNDLSCSITAIDDIQDIPQMAKAGEKPDPGTTAYIIFTSGSTGVPKGCPVSHKNLVRLFINEKSNFDFGPSDVWIMAHSFCFDFSVWEMYGALLFGGKLVIPDRKDVRDIFAFVRTVTEQKITVLNQTPGAFYKFSDTVLSLNEIPRLNLRYVIFGGDKLNPSRLNPWIDKYPAGKVKLINMYGITETTIHVTFHAISDNEIRTSEGSSNVGRPLPETRVYILDNNMMLSPVGVYGEIYVAGTGLCGGYLNRPDLTEKRFIVNPYIQDEIIYKSGDVGRWLYNGTIEYLSRCDSQVQIRGFRVEMNEVEIALRKYEGITDCTVTDIDREGTKELAAYIVSDIGLKISDIKNHLASLLPEYMIPSHYIRTGRIPLTSNGKLDRKALPEAVQNIQTGEMFENPRTALEAELLGIWLDILSAENISVHDNFFDVGGNSILLVKLHSKINSIYPGVLEMTDLFSNSRIASQAEFIARKLYGRGPEKETSKFNISPDTRYHDIAIIGMASRIGDCLTPDEFWNDLKLGVDFIGRMPEERISDIKALCTANNYDPESIKFREYCFLNEVDKFDYGFFKLSPGEASLIDPAQRMFLETAIHAIEDAGYGGNKLWGSRTGVFIGASDNLSEYAKFIDAAESPDANQLLTAQTPSILAGRLPYLLNLKGPAMLVDTACSSSLTALHLACQSIREGRIDSAIVGSTKVHLLPVDSGTRLEIDSSDARGHSFDDSADGTGGGEGVIAVFIKPLEMALKDKDNIYAVIKGSSVNQDGNSIGITAPDADAQADVIEQAWIDAGIDPLSVSFIETHGTATKLGDPIEIDGITKAFRRYTDKKQFCAIGAVKANIGHLDTAAGLAGLLKAVLSLKYRQLTPMAHFSAPNRNIKFDESPAYINTALTAWDGNGSPLRCGVSSFGLSGTNCHVVLEEAPKVKNDNRQEEEVYLLPISARTKDGLIEFAMSIKRTLYLKPDAHPEDVCYTLAAGRGHYPFRAAIIFKDIKELRNKISKFIAAQHMPDQENGIFYNSSRIAASNKKNLAPGEITEAELNELSRKINGYLSADDPDVKKARILAEAYVKGCNIEWEEYYKKSSPSRLSLPGYPFNKKRCWVEIRQTQKKPEVSFTEYGRKFENVFLNNCLIDTPASSVYSVRLSEDDWLLNEHRILNVPALVGAAHLQMAAELGRNYFNSSHLKFDSFYLLQPLRIEPGEVTEVLVSVNKNDENTLQANVSSRTPEGEWLNYAKYTVSASEIITPYSIDIDGIKARALNTREIIQSQGRQNESEIVSVSSKWDCLKKIWWNDDESLAELSVPGKDAGLASEYYFYPPLADAALSFALREPGYLPYSFGTAEISGSIPLKAYSYVTNREVLSSDTISCDIVISDSEGNAAAVLRQVVFRKLSRLKESYFHELTWKRRPLEKEETDSAKGILLLYRKGNDGNIISSLKATDLITAAEVENGREADVFEKCRLSSYSKIIYVLSETDLIRNFNAAEFETKLEETLFSFFTFIKYLAVNIQAGTDLLIAAPRVFNVTGNEDNLNSLLNSAAGLGQVLERECPNIRCRFFDFDKSFSASGIIDEIKFGFKESYYYRAYRDAERYIREIKVSDAGEREERNLTVTENGVYLITGGTGGIGLELADMLCSKAKIKLVLMNRSEFPVRELWDSIIHDGKDVKLCRKIEKLKELEKKAGALEIYKCDVSCFNQLKTAVEDIRLRMGRICGVIHAAGTAGKGFIFGKTFETFSNVIRPKIHATVYLSELLKTDNPDFFIMTSALTAIIPTAGQSDYTAANAFQDAFSFEMNKNGFRALSINLTSWKETGMAYEHGVVEDGIFRSISNADGSAAVSILLGSNSNSIILGIPDYAHLAGTENLPFFLNMEIKPRRNIKPGENKEKPASANTIILKGRESGSYTEYEIIAGSVWGKVLGYSEINIYDNYYDLGGDSIQAIKLVGMLEKRLNSQVTIGDLFNHLTVSELAEYLETRNGGNVSSVNAEEIASPIQPSGRSEWYPVSSAQRRLFILDRLSKDKLSYHIPGIWNITGKLKADAIITAFEKLLMRHEILRTSFVMNDDVPVQIVHESIQIDIPVKEITEPEARKYILEFIRPFDLGRAPLFRAEILKLNEENHLILFDAHHIITDGFSMEILKQELMTFYEGREPEPLKIQYRDYAIWQNDYYLSSSAAEKKAYWVSCFEGEIPLINLPLDFPRTAESENRAGTYTFKIDEKLFQKIKRISSDEGVSAFMILLTAYNIVLHKYSGQEDIITGVYTMGREKEELSKLIGMFINNLPVRTYPRENATISEYLNEVKNTAVMAFSNQDYPFDELVDTLRIKRDLNRSPLFDVVFSYMNYEMSRLQTSDLHVGDYDADITISSEYDLMLYGLEAEDEIMITVKYKESLFRQQSIERFAGHFTKVLGAMTGSRNLMLKDIDILLPEEVLLLNEYNRKSPEVTDKSDVIDLLKKAFAENKDKTALLYNDRAVTYRVLEEKTNRLATYLRTVHSVRPEDRIAIMLERTDNMAIAMLAVIKCGAAYVGIDTAYPESRVEYLLNDSKAGILITEQCILQDSKFKLPGGITFVDIDDPCINDCSSDDPVKVTTLDDLAYVIYTSGSTGNPKGVAITHKNLSVFLHWCFKEFGPSHYDIVYAVTSYCFDLSVFEIFFSLCAGKTVRILKSALGIPAYLPGDENVLINTVPSLMSSISDELGCTAISRIKAINLAGEQIPQQLIEKLDCGAIEVRNLYGPSEDTTYSTVYRFDSIQKKVLIGHPISNSRIYITDKNLKLVPPGHPGEICIAGDGLARGYLFRDELTAEKFIPNPFENGRLYRTGDLGRWTESGEIEYLGRIDRQVKIRGYRIELGEIETYIRSHPAVAAAVVTAFEKNGSKDMAAYIVPKQEILPEELKSWLGGLMPSYMVPIYIVMINELPLTPNGKVDIKALPEPGTDTDNLPRETEVLTPVERMLAAIWKNVLGSEVISRTDSFFDLGGHSLKALKLLMQINRTFSSSFILSDIFEYPSICSFARRIEKYSGDTLIPLMPLEKAGYYEVSHAQRRLWIINRVDKKSPAYNIPVVFHVNSALDISALKRAFDALIQKYESLRTYFIEVDGEPKQVILDDAEIIISTAGAAGEGSLLENSRELIQKAITEPFDLSKAPLLKVLLINGLINDEFILVINIHHIILDEWSIEILTSGLAAFYDHYSGKKIITGQSYFAPSKIQYKEYAFWHNMQISSGSLKNSAHREYWHEVFREPVQPLDLPADFPRPKLQTFEGKTESFSLPVSSAEGIKKLSIRNNTTLFVTTLALFNLLLSEYTGQNDIVVGTPAANRDHPDVQDQIGFYLNTLALRNRTDENESFHSFLDRVKKNTLGAFTHQAYPFDLLVDELELKRDLSRSPLFDVMLISQAPVTDRENSAEGPAMKAVGFDYPVSKFDLSVSFYEHQGTVKFVFEYNTALFRSERIRNMFSHFCQLTEIILKDEDVKLSQIKLISQDERLRMKLLSEGENSLCSFSSVVSLIENTAVEHCVQTAVVFKRKKINYKDLNCLASQATRLLKENFGIGAGDPVCIMLDRSEWSVIAMLAVLKAGGAYTPLDPDFPKNRKEYILNDCGSRVLITSGKYRDEVSFEQGKIITVEEILERASDYSGENLELEIALDSAAYIIYTSGSTGEPKGVTGTHRCLLNLVSWQLSAVGKGLKTLQYAPHIFDVSVQEILFSLASGGSLYMIENETRYKMSQLSEIIEKEKIEILTMPYSALNLFLGETEDFASIRSLKHLITSGEQPFINSHLEKLMKMYPALRFHNQYGPSETHVVSSYSADGSMSVLPEKVPMGRPVSNTQLYVLDKEMEFVPQGMQGELYIGGDNVACGYINRQELTDEKFIQNPFGPGRLYKSGDLARWNFDNELEYLGRDDGQVKVRGFRIELGEIEACLLKYPDIKEAAVKLTEDDENKEIVAYFASQTEIVVSVLRDFLFSYLPSYMVPGYFVKIDAFPRTSSGKIDLKRLPAPEKLSNPAVSDFADPSGETEIIIAEVWKEVLKREIISSNDNFFELGGNSIKAIQVMSKVQKRLGKKTYLNLIFQQPTIRKMAATILGTEERLKSLDTDTALLNGEHERKIFFLPPGIGYSFAYMEYAKYFDDCSVYGLNFTESLSPAKSMADIMLDLQPEGKFFLFGHSAGGNMAYDTALELQKQGREIGGLVLLDSYRQLELIDWSPEEYLEDAVLYIEQNHAEFLDEQIRDAALKKIVAYRKYLNSRIEETKVAFRIIQIEAGGELIKFKHRISRSAWGELTPHYEVFEGAGGHMDMLKQPNLKKNALLTKKLFDNLFINHSGAAF